MEVQRRERGTRGHSRTRLSCKSAILDRSAVPARGRVHSLIVPVSYPRSVACSQNRGRRQPRVLPTGRQTLLRSATDAGRRRRRGTGADERGRRKEREISRRVIPSWPEVARDAAIRMGPVAGMKKHVPVPRELRERQRERFGARPSRASRSRVEGRGRRTTGRLRRRRVVGRSPRGRR
jgi:hypothetical protein